MLFIRFTAPKHYACVAAKIFLLSEIMSFYSYHIDKGLVYIIIIVLFSRQPFSYIKCTKLNMRLSCNI